MQQNTHQFSFTNLFAMQGPLEQPEECSQAKPVHVVDLAKVRDDEEQLATILWEWKVGAAFLVQGGLKPHWLCQGLADGDAAGFGLVEGVQQLLILQDVAFGVGKLLKQGWNVNSLELRCSLLLVI